MRLQNFRSHTDFSTFSNSVKKRNRYVLDNFQSEFIDAVVSTSEKRTAYIKKGTGLWRAQKGFVVKPKEIDQNQEVIKEECPYLPERMFPIEGKCSEGRTNPGGIKHLYLSNEKYTALAEVRPWLGSIISLGLFEVLKDLKVVDCSKDEKISPLIWDGENFVEPILVESEKENVVWGDINDAFSMPIDRNDLIAEYVPTQILSEAFKMKGFDGIVYKSSLGCGFNVAIFDLKGLELKQSCLWQLKSINYKFQQIGNPFRWSRK
jgi:RES domain